MIVEKALKGEGYIVPMMPNLACAVGEGATAVALGSNVAAARRARELAEETARADA